MIIKTVKVLRNNWKKSVFFTGLIGYVSNYFHTNYKINCLMKEYCQNATAFGEQRLSVFAQPKHITVILNPRSKRSKCRKYFNEYVAPILHCAGYKVSIIETESQGQAVQLMEIMSNTDAVLIAGGSGTIQEAITGLLRREDADKYARSLPVAFLPLGANNRTFNKLYKDDYSNSNLNSKRLHEVRVLADCAMKIVNDKRTDLNVLRIHNLDSQKTVFSLNKLEFGVLTELKRQSPQHWYFGYLADYYVYLKATLFRKLSVLELGATEHPLTVYYTEKCGGCSKCFDEFKSPELDDAKQRAGGWFSMFRSADQRRNDQIQLNIESRLKSKVNADCGKWKSVQLDRLLNVQIENCPKSDQPELRLKIVRNTDELTKGKFYAFMKSYPNQEDDGNANSLELNVKELKFDISTLNDKQSNDESNDEEQSKNKLNYFIDDENYDVKNNLELNSKFRKILTFV